MNSFEEAVLDKWLAELQTTIEENDENGDGVYVWEIDEVDKLYCKITTSDDDKQAYEYTIDGAKQLESENDLQHSVKNYKSVSDVQDETIESALDSLTIEALNDWFINSRGGDEYILRVDDIQNGDELTWDLFVELMNRQRVTDDDLLNYDYIYCGTYYYDTQAVDDLSEIHTFEEWSKLFETEDRLYETIMA